jgi:hypothetical protein
MLMEVSTVGQRPKHSPPSDALFLLRELLNAVIITETDRFDSANLSVMDVAAPKGVILLGLIIDPRTGLLKGHVGIYI